MPIKILIAEDQRLLRQCFKESLDAEENIEVVATASDGREAIVLTERHTPDLVLMDMAMPNLDGVKSARMIRKRVPDTKILMLSLHDDADHVSTAMRAGVEGFVSKDVDIEELVNIIGAVAGGKPIQSPFLADQRVSSTSDISNFDLTPREIEAMRLLVRGYSNSEIATKLCVSEQTVKKEFVTIFNRLGVKNRTQAAVRGVQLGLLDSSSDI